MISWLINPFSISRNAITVGLSLSSALTAHFDVTLIVSHDERRLKLNQNGYQFFSTASCTVTRAMFYSDVKNNVYKGKTLYSIQAYFASS